MIQQTTDDPTLRGLDTVRVNKESLLAIVEGNRAEHRAIFLEAIDSWHEKVQAKLKEMVKLAKDKEKVVLAVGLPKPEDHTSDYDRVIKMLNMSLDDELELDEHEFAKFVMDDWGWQRAFLATSSNYTTSATDKLNRMS